MNSFFKNKDDIKSWLDMYHIKSYKLIEDKEYGFVVDVYGDVELSIKNLSFIPVKFNTVEGDFHCAENELLSLIFCPQIVNGSFYCNYNKLTSLKYSPIIVKKSFVCSNNYLTSLESCPLEIKKTFNCSYNQLKSLNFCPIIINDYFYCDNNQFESLEFCPNIVRSNHLDCSGNPQLGSIQNTTNFKEVYQEHLRVKEIIAFNKKLQKNLVNYDSKIVRKNKI